MTENKETFKLPVAVVGLLFNNDDVLLVRRKNFPEGWAYIGGSLEEDDASLEGALARETGEEVSIQIAPKEFTPVTARIASFGFVVCYFMATVPDRFMAINNEPDQHSAISWFNVQHLLFGEARILRPAEMQVLMQAQRLRVLHGETK